MSNQDIHNPMLNELDDDDGMPPLVDYPCPSMTFTFATDMTPISYSTDPTSFEVVPEKSANHTFIYDPPAEPALGATRNSHAKKRDASYIPRPPNAFILFRSSFIRAQHIPGKIEGNHSALSKIIGKYWKSLPREEREVWEAKAIVAQAEHRKKYPDWRFRPGANALAKVKDGPKRRANRKGRGEAEKEERSREKRCAKIADLLVAGKKGSELEVAIEAYDCETGGARDVKSEGCGYLLMQVKDKAEGVTSSGNEAGVASLPVKLSTQKSSANSNGRKEARSLSPDASHDIRFKTPLTSMFKRSSSAPAPLSRDPDDTPSVHSVPSLTRRDSLSSASSVDAFETAPTPPYVADHEDQARVTGDITTMSDSSRGLKDGNGMSASHVGFSPNADYTPCTQITWADTYNSTIYDVNTHSPTLPAFEPDLDENPSPAQSPLAYSYDLLSEGDRFVTVPFLGSTSTTEISSLEGHYTHVQSSYSTLKGWAGDVYSKCSSFGFASYPDPYVLGSTQAPMVYNPDNVMKDAFAAAANAPYEDWGNVFRGPGRFCASDYVDGLQHYAQGLQDMTRRQDNSCQLF